MGGPERTGEKKKGETEKKKVSGPSPGGHVVLSIKAGTAKNKEKPNIPKQEFHEVSENRSGGS